jgi:hypothetical protein
MVKHTDDKVRAQFTHIGCIMEDASVVALNWDPAVCMTVQSRYKKLLEAHRKIEEALQQIATILEIP